MTPNDTYKISAPALLAARKLLVHFDLIEKGDTEACVDNVATIIDAHTQAFRIKAAMKYLFSQVNWLDNPDAGEYLEDRLEELQDSVDKIDELRRSLPRFSDESEAKLNGIGLENRESSGQRADTKRQARILEVNPLALHATRMLMEHYHFVEKTGQVRRNERQIAMLINMCTRLYKLQDALHLMCTRTPWMHVDELRRDLEVMRKSLRAVDSANMYLPGYGGEMPKNLKRVPMGQQWAKESYEPSEHELRRKAQLQEVLAQCKPGMDQQRIMAMLREVV